MKRKIFSMMCLFIMMMLSTYAYAGTQWTCPYCGNENNSEFCGNCGINVHAIAETDEREINIERSEKWYCFQCGAEGSQKFCTECGNKRDEGYVGTIICFGAYEQDNVIENGQESIEWICLENKNGKIKLLSRKALETKEFDENGSNFWENSSLRSWLNQEFYNYAFTDEEKLYIIENQIGDKISLFDSAQTSKYFNKNEMREVTITKYAESKSRTWSNLDIWFVFDKDDTNRCAGYYGCSGSFTGEYGKYGGTDKLLVRPLITLILDPNAIDEITQENKNDVQD